MLRISFALSFSIAILFSTSAFAADGQILINQATVNAAGGFPYKITQPGSYKLSGNLTVLAPNSDAIDINADNVTLDLNGFSIIGPGCSFFFLVYTCEGSPNTVAINSQSSGVAVLNGSITGFSAGVMLSGMGGYVSQLRVQRNSTGIQATHAIVAHNNASANNFGIITDASTVTENVANQDAIQGFEINGGVFRGNTADGSKVALSSTTSSENNDCNGSSC